MNLDLTGKHALVCGGSQGIGKAAAMGFDLDEIEPPRGDSDEELLTRMIQKLPSRH